MVLGFVPYTIFGIAWHRVTLLGPAAGAPPLVPAWRQRHWRFLGYLAAVTLIGYGVTVMVFSIAFSVVPPAVQPGAEVTPRAWSVVLVAGTLILAYVMMRLSFVFPAVAVDEAYRLKHSWTHTKGQGLRLLGALILTAIPILTLVGVVSALFGDFPFADPAAPEAGMEAVIAENPVAIFVSPVVMMVLNYLLMALVVSVISIAFRTCTGWVPALAGPPDLSPPTESMI